MGPRRDVRPPHTAARSRTRELLPPKPSMANPTKMSQEEENPQPVIRPLQEVQRVNQRCIEMLTQAARKARREMSPLAVELRAVLLELTPEMRARAACRTFLLVDMELANADLWRRFKTHPTRTEATPTGRETFPRATAIQLARATLVLAWYGVRTDRHGAKLLLGMSAAVSDIIASLSLVEIDRIAERQFRHVRPRWEDRPDFWLKLLSASQTSDIRRARDVNLRGLQLIVGTIVSPPNPSISRFRSQANRAPKQGVGIASRVRARADDTRSTASS
jgi:hypothetical protein